MSTSPPSTNGAASQIAWIRSPVAIDAFVARGRAPARAAFSGGTGSSSQRGSSARGRPRPGRGVRRETAVHLDHQPDVWSDRLSDRGHDRDRAPPVARREPDARRPERIELHRSVPARDHVPCQLRDPCRFVIGLVPAVGICGDAVTEAAAEQPPDRDAELLPHEVERGDSKAARADCPCSLGPAVLEAFDRPGQPLGVERVGTDDVAGGQLLDGRNERVGLVDRPDLTDAGQPGRSRVPRRRARAMASRRPLFGHS